MAYSRFKLSKTGSMLNDLLLYTEFKENWQYFFSEGTMVPDGPGDVDKVLTVKGHSRRRGPGAPARSVAGHSRYYIRSAKTKGSARPGKTFIITEPAILGTKDQERRQFSIHGTDADVIAYARAKAKFLIHITNEAGWTVVVPGVSGGTLAATSSGSGNP